MKKKSFFHFIDYSLQKQNTKSKHLRILERITRI